MRTSGHVFYLTLIALLTGGLIFTYHEMDRRSQISTRNEMVLYLLAKGAYIAKPYGAPFIVEFSDGPKGYAEAYHIFKSRDMYWGLSFPTTPPYRAMTEKQLEDMRKLFKDDGTIKHVMTQ